jgi:ketosteroid isomerase-like protein
MTARWTMASRLLLIAALLACAITLASCKASRNGLPGTGGGADQVRAVLSLFAQAFNQSDLATARSLVSDLYSVDPTISSRFRVKSGNVPSDFTGFFSLFFTDNQNVQVTITVQSVDVTGNVATATGEFILNATYLLDIPPSAYNSDTTDIFTFDREEDGWKIVGWQKQP